MYIASLFVINMEGMVFFSIAVRSFLFVSMQNVPLLIGILVLCALFSHSYMLCSGLSTEY